MFYDPQGASCTARCHAHQPARSPDTYAFALSFHQRICTEGLHLIRRYHTASVSLMVPALGKSSLVSGKAEKYTFEIDELGLAVILPKRVSTVTVKNILAPGLPLSMRQL